MKTLDKELAISDDDHKASEINFVSINSQGDIVNFAFVNGPDQEMVRKEITDG